MDLSLTLVAGALAARARGNGVDEKGQCKAENDGWAKTEHCSRSVRGFGVCVYVYMCEMQLSR
jgi:hypothetical protein